MKSELTKFNLICEEIILEARKQSFLDSFSKKWYFEDELDAILPFILKKCVLAFTNFYEQGKPGNPEINSEPEIEPVDEGTQNPGFKISYNLDGNYVKNNLLPCLLADKNSRFARLYTKYTMHTDETKLVLILNASVNKNINLDLAKITKNNSKIPKFSISDWEGDLYLNFKCDGVERDQSNVKIGTIDTKVDVQEYKPLASKIFNFLITSGKDVDFNQLSDQIGDGIANILGIKPKNDNTVDKIKGKSLLGNIGKVPGCDIKCTVKINRELKKNIELGANDNAVNVSNTSSMFGFTQKDIENVLKTSDFTVDLPEIESNIDPSIFFKHVLHYNTRDNIELFDTDITGNNWVAVKYNGPKSFTDLNNPIDKNTEYVCAFVYQRFMTNVLNGWEKHYNIFININDWKNASGNDPKKLINKNTVVPLVRIDIKDNNYEDVLSIWYDWNEFEKAEKIAYNVFKQRILAIKSKIK